MARERPPVERPARDREFKKLMSMGSAIISPCTGCQNNLPQRRPSESTDVRRGVPKGAPWPCPKQVLYAQRDAARDLGDASRNYSHPVYDPQLKARNPVWPGLQLNSPSGEKYSQRYAYVFLAFFDDNSQSGSGAFQRSGRGGLNIDTSRIRCRGPYLLASTERQWNLMGTIDQGDTVLAFNTYYFIDGAEFQGYALEAATWQVATGYSRKIDSNLGRTLSGASRYS